MAKSREELEELHNALSKAIEERDKDRAKELVRDLRYAELRALKEIALGGDEER